MTGGKKAKRSGRCRKSTHGWANGEKKKTFDTGGAGKANRSKPSAFLMTLSMNKENKSSEV